MAAAGIVTDEDVRVQVGSGRRAHVFRPQPGATFKRNTLRDGGEVIGWGGLCVDPFDPAWGPEVAYFVHPRLWGRGLASEIVEAALALAFRELALPAVGAFARPQNAASLRVLEKQGFRFVRYLPDMDRNQYAIDQERYQACRD